jgi:hypothetical protein
LSVKKSTKEKASIGFLPCQHDGYERDIIPLLSH